MQDELLHSPVGQFANVEQVGIAAIDFVYSAKLFGQLLSARPNLPRIFPVRSSL